MQPSYFTGLDVGQAQEFTAVAVLERAAAREPDGDGPLVTRYAVRHLERFPPGTAYAAVAARLAGLFAAPPLVDSPLVVDQTAVGRPVVDLLHASGVAAEVCPVTVTAGHSVGLDDRGGWLVPKKELVSALQVLLQSRRLQVAPALAEAQTLARELTTFRVKVVAAAADAAAWRDGPHDDLVLAVAVAAWEGERRPPAAGSAVPEVCGGRPPDWPWGD
jgi:hypothetical protein